jgi:hypothetical protein
MANEHTLTRKAMEDVIDGGGSVMIGHRIITSKDDLPSAAALTAGADDAAATADDLDAQIAALQAQRALLDAPPVVEGDGTTTGQSDGTADATGDFEQELTDTVGAGPARALLDAGYESGDAISATSDTELLQTPGVGQASVDKLRAKYPAAP